MARERDSADVRILAARVRVKADKRLQRETPRDIRELARKNVTPSRDIRSAG